MIDATELPFNFMRFLHLCSHITLNYAESNTARPHLGSAPIALILSLEERT